jgi:hypothetical protein
MKDYALPFAPAVSRLRRHQSLLLILVVFVTFRLAMPFVFRSGSYFVEQAPDIGDYLRWGALADSGLYPFVHYWSEYPPLFGWSMIGLYRLSTLLPAWGFDQRLWLAVILQIALTLCDVGSVILIYAIARRLGSKARAVRTAALFAASFIAAYAASSWFDTAPAFFMLLALYLALCDHWIGSGVAAGIGIMTKIVPIVVVPLTLRRSTAPRPLLKYVIALGATVLISVAPFFLVRSDLILAFLQSTFNRPTWLSVWALFDGNYQYGTTVPLIDRFSTANIGTPPPTQLPWPLINLAFLAIFLFIYTRRADWRKPANSIALGGLTVNLFLLWSKGFSGQFIVYAFPFLVLLMPNLRGVLYAALLSVLWVAEWPLAFVPLENQNWFIVWIVLARTAMLIGLCVEYAARVFPRASRAAWRTGNAVLLLGWLSVVPASVLAVNAYTTSTLQADAAMPGLDLIRAQSGDRATPIAFGQTRLFRRLYPAARDLGEPTLLPVFKHAPEEARLDWLRSLGSRGSFWFISDAGDLEAAGENLQAETWMSDHACRVASTNAGSARVSRFIAPLNAMDSIRPIGAVFNEEIALNGFQLSQSALKPGDGLCVELKWQALKQPSADDTVFVHVLNAAGQLVAQNDMQPRSGFAPTSQWRAGATINDRHGVILPPDLPAGEYIVRAGLYRSDDQASVPPGAIDLAKITVAPQ